jgi:hypothetical protein
MNKNGKVQIDSSVEPFNTLRAVRCVEWRETQPGAFILDGKPLWVATHYRFNSKYGIFLADGKGGMIMTKEKGEGYNQLPIAGAGKTAKEALRAGEAP